MLSKLARGNADITLDNESIRSVVKSVLSEAFQLYTAQGNTISVDKGDGKEISPFMMVFNIQYRLFQLYMVNFKEC